MLTVSDVYDFYGLSLLKEEDLQEEPRKLFNYFLTNIRDNYVKTLKRRIIEEAGYLGMNVDGTNLESLISNLSKKLNQEISRQAANMAASGVGFDMMSMIRAQQQKPKPALEGAADAFRSSKGKSRSLFGGEPWAKISEAFLAIDRAQTAKNIILAIDHLNDLQHNCCHVIFDLTGTRGGGGDSHAAVKAVLDDKQKAKTPHDFADKMSGDVRDFLKEVGAL